MKLSRTMRTELKRIQDEPTPYPYSQQANALVRRGLIRPVGWRDYWVKHHAPHYELTDEGRREKYRNDTND